MFPGLRSLWMTYIDRRYSRATTISAVICLARMLLRLPCLLRNSRREPLGQNSTNRYSLFWFLKD